MAQSDAVSAAIPLPAAARHSALGEEVLAVYAYTPATLAGLAAGFFMLVTLFWPSAPTAVIFPWMALFVGLWFVRIVLARGALHLEVADTAPPGLFTAVIRRSKIYGGQNALFVPGGQTMLS